MAPTGTLIISIMEVIMTMAIVIVVNTIVVVADPSIVCFFFFLVTFLSSFFPYPKQPLLLVLVPVLL